MDSNNKDFKASPAIVAAKTTESGFKLKQPRAGRVITKSRLIDLAKASQEDLEYLYNLNAKWASRIDAPQGYRAAVSKKK